MIWVRRLRLPLSMVEMALSHLGNLIVVCQPTMHFKNSGTPKDYSEDLYRFYLEVVDRDFSVKGILIDFLGPQNVISMSDKPYGYEFDMPIQRAPDVIRNLAKANIAIYQLVRIGRVSRLRTY